MVRWVASSKGDIIECAARSALAVCREGEGVRVCDLAVKEEGAGPGAAFHTLRSLNLMVPIAQDMEELCPDALLINFSNPESRVCLGVSKLTRINVVGLCHGPILTLERISEALNRPPEEIELTVGGINHFHWALEIREKASGRDLYPDIDKVVDRYEWDFKSFTALLYKSFGRITYPAPSHPGEYLGFAHEIIGPKNTEWGIGRVGQKLSAKGADLEYMMEGRRGIPSYELWSMDLVKRIDDFLAGKIPITTKDVFFKTDLTHPSKELAIPIILDIELDRKRRELAGNVVNRGLRCRTCPRTPSWRCRSWWTPKGCARSRSGHYPRRLRACASCRSRS